MKFTTLNNLKDDDIDIGSMLTTYKMSGSSVVDNTLTYNSRDVKIDLPLLRCLDKTVNRGPFYISMAERKTDVTI